jgi:hypothetical protein
MRPVNYLADISNTFGVELKTMQVIDRMLVENGLRRKGTGRTIPFPTRREDLLTLLAANLLPEASPMTIAAAVTDWAEMPARGASGERLRERLGKSLLTCLEDLCDEISEDSTVALGTRVDLDKTHRIATIEYEDGFLSFTQGVSRVFGGITIRRITGPSIAEIAHRHKATA